MKRYFFLAVMMMTMLNIFALKNWRVYTNTTYIYDMEIISDKAYFATWGGLDVYDLSTDNFVQKLTTIDGLSKNEIRTIDYYNGDQLLLGTFGGGIDRYDFNEFLLPLDEVLGVASNYVYDIAHQDSLIFVISKTGLSVFADDPSFPFPLLVSNFNASNGLSFDEITSIELADDYVFCGSIAGLDYVHIDSLTTPDAWHHLNSNNSILPSDNVTSISIAENKIAVGTDNGLLISKDLFDPNQTELIDAGLPIYPAIIDQDMNVWYSYGIWDLERLVLYDTMETAVTRIADDGAIQTWQITNDGLTTNKIKGFYDLFGNICAYSWGEGVFLFQDISINGRSTSSRSQRTEWQTNIKANCLSANLISDIEIDQNKKLWVATGYYGLEQLGKGTKGVCSFDGSVWEDFTKEKYPGLKNNNVLDIEIDSSNRKWFSSWQFITGGNGGISILEADESDLYTLEGFPTTYNTRFTADEDNMWVAHIGGVVIFKTIPEIDTVSTFETEFDEGQKIMNTFVSDDYRFFGTWDKGVQYWNHDSDPVTHGDYWFYHPSSELRSSTIHDFASSNANGFEEIWVASGMGLFKFDGIDWFWYGTSVKMKVWQDNHWFWSEDVPDPTYWYYEGQERLYGSNPTYPTTLFVDPFDLIWIGTVDAGITIFNKDRDTFTTLTVDNSPLISNSITSLVYEESTGTLYIGTIDGMNSVEIGIPAQNNDEENLNKTVAFPNPFYPERGEVIRIENTDSNTMPAGDTKCMIYDLNGELILKLEKDLYKQFSWDGTNNSGKRCSSGIYFYLISAPGGQSSKGKIALIR
jgi:ligand-binding sensor domain-containing protein